MNDDDWWTLYSYGGAIFFCLRIQHSFIEKLEMFKGKEFLQFHFFFLSDNSHTHTYHIGVEYNIHMFSPGTTLMSNHSTNHLGYNSIHMVVLLWFSNYFFLQELSKFLLKNRKGSMKDGLCNSTNVVVHFYFFWIVVKVHGGFMQFYSYVMVHNFF